MLQLNNVESHIHFLEKEMNVWIICIRILS